MNPATRTLAAWLIASGAAVACVMVGWASQQQLDPLWDEIVDRDIAAGLFAHPVAGESPPLDVTQLRLPMYVNALAFAIAGQSDIDTARCVSLIAAAATILAAAGLARLLFGPLAAALAALLLALSPYFLSFARIAMTEGDIFFALFTTLAVWQFVRYQQQPTPGRWTGAAVLLGLALGTKFFALFLFLLFGVMDLSTQPHRRLAAPSDFREVRRFRRRLTVAMLLLLATFACALLETLAARRGHPDLARWFDRLVVTGWLVLGIVWIHLVWLGASRRILAHNRAIRLLSMFTLAVLTTCVLMPVHLSQDAILRALARRMLRWDDRIPLALWDDHLRLYAGIILIKLVLPLGILTAGALIYAAIRERTDPRWRPGVLAFVYYVVPLCFLPLRQAFYLMGVYPLVLILTAGFVVQIGAWLRRTGPWLAGGWCLVVVGLLAWQGVDTARAFPNFHLYGYHRIEDRWLGAESRGYRNLIQTPSDGVVEAVRWCLDPDHVPPGSRVVSYFWEDHIIRETLPEPPPFVFVPRGLTLASDDLPPPPPIGDADFVFLHINNLLGYGDRPPDHPPLDLLEARFTVVHTVTRDGFPMAWIYGRAAD